VVRIRQWRVPVGVGLVWGLAAYVSLALRAAGEGMLLIWMPSAIAIAALAGVPRRRWPPILLAIAGAMFAVCFLRGIPLASAAGFAGAQVAEAALCVTLGRWVLGPCRIPQTFRHLLGLFLATLAASAVSTLISIPFRTEAGLLQTCWWFLTTALGMLVGTPILVYASRILSHSRARREMLRRVPPRLMAAIVGGFFALAWPIFRYDLLALVPLVICALVLTVLRAGQMGAAGGVFAFALAATAHAMLDGFPPLFGQRAFVAGLILQGYMLLMLATALPLASVLIARTKLEEGLRARNAELKDNLTILNLTKTLAGIGRWRLDLVTGEQEWSEQMLVLNGLSPDLAPNPGDVRVLLPDGGRELFGQLAAHRDTRIPYSFEYTVSLPGGPERVLKLNAFNEFAEGRRVAIFAVAMDVSEERRRERALVAARMEAIERAAVAQRLANTDSLTGLANRRSTFDWLDRLVAGCGEAGEPLSVLMFDIDRFKRINDSLGHQMGDEVLCRIAELARRELRAEDLLGRIGGEEFICLLPGITASVAAILAERLRRAVANGTGSDDMPQVTISIGVAAYRSGDTPHDMVARADMALYGAKEAGRNQVREAA
jgi:diguanylate cyclase (GGDEF)-like protein